MTSIAAYLASLAGGAPQEGQKTTQTGTTGAAGVFAALLSSVQGDAAPEAANTQGKDTLLGLLSTAENQIDPAIAAQLADLAENDPRLAKLLAQGLPGIDSDITAAINPPDVTTGPVPAADGLIAADGEPTVAPQVTETEGNLPPSSTPLPVSIGDEVESPRPDAAVFQPLNDGEAETGIPVRPAQVQDKDVPGEPAPRNKGLANALQHASESGQRNGLQNAASHGRQTASGQTVQNTQTATVQTNPMAPDGDAAAATGKAASGEARPNRPQIAGANENEQSSRSELQQPVRPRVTVQRILDAGNGKSVIQIHERAGGEAVSTASPPTLTVNVQASAASPGPASPNTPHVPVSALAVHIAQQHNKGARRFDIMMDPPELGRIEVRLDVTRDGQVTTHLVVERSETLDLLQRDARQLERALQGAGLNTSEDGMKFSLKDQGLAQEDNDGSQKGDDGEGKPDVTADDGSDPTQDMPPVRYMATTGIDIRI